MKKLLILAVVLMSCSSTRIDNDIKVAWEITYQNNIRERVMARQRCKIVQSGCFMDRRKVVRCNVRSARRIPLHQVEKDGVMYELD